MIQSTFFILVFCSIGYSQITLKQVHVVFRHGDRTPDSRTNYPGNPYINDTYYPYGIGELTLDGKRNSYLLGLNMRRIYGKFLGDLYHNGLIKAFSSNYNRAQSTLQCVLSALFPPTMHSMVFPGVLWQPIPYTTLVEDTILAVHNTCPIVTENPPSHVTPEEQKLYDYISENAGVPIKSNTDVFMIQNLFQVQEELGMKLPDWVHPIWPDIMKKQALKSWAEKVDKILPQLSGNLVNKILMDSQGFINKTVEEKLFLYSGHDMNIVAMLGALGVYKEGLEINYNAIVYFELHLINGVNGFKIFFNNRELIRNPVLIPGCQEFCPLTKFKELVVDKLYRGANWCN